MLCKKESTRPLSSLNYFWQQRKPLALQLFQSYPGICFLSPISPGSSDLSFMIMVAFLSNAKNENLDSPPYSAAYQQDILRQ